MKRMHALAVQLNNGQRKNRFLERKGETRSRIRRQRLDTCASTVCSLRKDYTNGIMSAMARPVSGESFHPPPPAMAPGGSGNTTGILGIVAGSLCLLGWLVPAVDTQYIDYGTYISEFGGSVFYLTVMGLGAIISGSLLLCGRQERTTTACVAGFTSTGGVGGLFFLLHVGSYQAFVGFYITILALLVEAFACIVAIRHMMGLQAENGHQQFVDEEIGTVAVQATPTVQAKFR